jgi:hypothetical protein
LACARIALAPRPSCQRILRTSTWIVRIAYHRPCPRERAAPALRGLPDLSRVC